ncbi:MAG: hypothetical protein GY759_00670 [Chloroflexi bacterium]|nr:hypothetical protein [Chloroflexota bacterium]
MLNDESWVPERHRSLLGLGRDFRRELGNSTSVPVVSIFGYGLKTNTGLQVQRSADGIWQDIKVMEEPGGDASLPEVSTVLNGSEIHPVEQAHGSLYVDQDVKIRLKLELMR